MRKEQCNSSFLSISIKILALHSIPDNYFDNWTEYDTNLSETFIKIGKNRIVSTAIKNYFSCDDGKE